MWYVGFSLQWVSLSRCMGSRLSRLQQLWHVGSVVAAGRLWSIASVVVAHGLVITPWHVESSRTKDQTLISCIWTTREAPKIDFKRIN